MTKEQLFSVRFNVAPVVMVRVIESDDPSQIKDEKKKYPFKLHNSVIVTVLTDKRKFSFQIKSKYVWNGADIPRPLWRLVGSRTDNAFLTASMVHDYLLEFKNKILSDVLMHCISMSEYRRLTTLIFREILKQSGTGTIKANVMSWAVQMFQSTFNRKAWK